MTNKPKQPPTLTDTINVLGEIRDHLRHHPRWVEALSAAASGLHEAEMVIAPFADAAEATDGQHATDDLWQSPASTNLYVGQLRQAEAWLTKHGARP